MISAYQLFRREQDHKQQANPLNGPEAGIQDEDGGLQAEAKHHGQQPA